MKLAFVQKYPFPQFGIMTLSAGLDASWEREVFIADLTHDLAVEVAGFAPDVIALGVMSLEYRWARQVLPQLRDSNPRALVIAGGIHCTLDPESMTRLPVDAFAVGEADTTLPAFLAEYARTGQPGPAPGFWTRQGERFVPPAQPGFTAEIGHLPDEDRDLYYRKYQQLRDEPLKQFLVTRGCPFACAFCCHQPLRERYGNPARYVRRKTPEQAVREISSACRAGKTAAVCFLDDMFVTDLGWLHEFTRRYTAEIGLPYFCALAPSLVTDAVARLLRAGGCHTVNLGVESANEARRRELLAKPVSDRDLAAAAAVLKRHGLRLQTTNLFGLPGESVEDAWETIEFNRRLGTDYLCANMLTPFPGTAIERLAMAQGWLRRDYYEQPEYSNFHQRSLFPFPGIRRSERIQKMAHILLRWPRLLPLARWLSGRDLPRFFFWLFVASTWWRYTEEKKVPRWPALRMFWRARASYRN